MMLDRGSNAYASALQAAYRERLKDMGDQDGRRTLGAVAMSLLFSRTIAAAIWCVLCPFVSAEEKLVVQLDLMIEIELKRKIASYGDELLVLSPASLKEEMARFFQKAAQHYAGE